MKKLQKIQGADDCLGTICNVIVPSQCLFSPSRRSAKRVKPSGLVAKSPGVSGECFISPGGQWPGEKRGIEWTFFARKNSSEKKISKKFTILRVNVWDFDLDRWLMVFSGRVRSPLSESGITESTRLLCRVRFAEYMIFCLRLNMVAQVDTENWVLCGSCVM